jgi:hypothetical protein
MLKKDKTDLIMGAVKRTEGTAIPIRNWDLISTTYHINEPKAISEKTVVDFAEEFEKFLIEANDEVNDIVERWDAEWDAKNPTQQLVDLESAGTPSPTEYHRGLMELAREHWRNKKDDFFFTFNRQNLKTTFDLLESKEFKSAFSELKERARISQEEIERVGSSGTPSSPLVGPGKIRWLGTATQAALVFQYLQGAGLIPRNWAQLLKGHFEARDGSSMSNYLPQLASDPDEKTTEERARISAGIKAALDGETPSKRDD